VAPLLADDGVMISLQNGLGNVEAVERAVGAERALGCAGDLRRHGPGPRPRARDRLRRSDRHRRPRPGRTRGATPWRATGPRASTPPASRRLHRRLPAMLWAKVFYNAALNPLGALLDLHYGALPEHPESRGLMDAVIDEAFAVATAEGVSLTWPNAGAYRAEFYGRLVPSTYDHRSSMLQDLERGRRTEIDAINGAVWQRGAERGIQTLVKRGVDEDGSDRGSREQGKRQQAKAKGKSAEG
jgi:2-dehydropantoate 2-reductase